MVLTCQLRWGKAQNRNSGLCQQFCVGESCASSSCLDARQSRSLLHALVPLELLLQSWSSEAVSPSASMPGPFKRKVGDSSSPRLSHYPLLFLQPEVMGTSLPGTRTLGWGTWCGAGTPHSAEGNLHSRDLSPNWYLSHAGVGPARSASPTSLDVAAALFLSCRISVQLDFRRF